MRLTDAGSRASQLRKIFFAVVCALVLCAGLYAAQQPRLDAGTVLANAKTAAAAGHKHIFLIFGASWCTPCHLLDAFLADKQMGSLIAKHFVVAHLSVEEEQGKHPELNTPGAESLRTELGGKASGVPFLVFLDEHGQVIVNSFRPSKEDPKGENIGYPVLSEEIDWFMTMLKKTLPEQTQADAQAIEDWLQKAAANQ